MGPLKTSKTKLQTCLGNLFEYPTIKNYNYNKIIHTTFAYLLKIWKDILILLSRSKRPAPITL